MHEAYRKLVSVIGTVVATIILSGVYHYEHSAPFNALEVAAILTVAGLVTSAFFLAYRDVYATSLFHNFLSAFGVVQALKVSNRLDAFQTIQTPLLIMAVLALRVMGTVDWLLLRGHPTLSASHD